MPSAPCEGAPSRILRQARQLRQRAARQRTNFQQRELTERIAELSLELDEKNEEVLNLKSTITKEMDEKNEKQKEVDNLKIANSDLKGNIAKEMDENNEKLKEVENLKIGNLELQKALEEKDLVITELKSFVCSCWDEYAGPCSESRLFPDAVVCVIQRKWRDHYYFRKLQDELQAFARKTVENQGANDKSRNLVARMRTVSKILLMLRLRGEELPRHHFSWNKNDEGSVVLDRMVKTIADEMVVKILSKVSA